MAASSSVRFWAGLAAVLFAVLVVGYAALVCECHCCAGSSSVCFVNDTCQPRLAGSYEVATCGECSSIPGCVGFPDCYNVLLLGGCIVPSCNETSTQDVGLFFYTNAV